MTESHHHLNNLPGVDYHELIDLYGNQPERLQRFLISFREKHLQFMHKLIAAIDDQDINQVRLLAHSLKGASGMVAMPELSAAAFALEKACKQAEPQLDPQVSALETRLNEVLQGLEQLSAD